MNVRPIKIEALRVEDIEVTPVWEYVNDDQLGETAVLPVKDLPVDNLAGKVIGTKIKMANGDSLWALVGNVDERNQALNEQFLTISVERDGHWFPLARYHDSDYKKRGPLALAEFLGLNLEQVFPISYDLRQYVSGEPSILASEILKEPRTKLTGDQLIAMAL